MKEITPMLSTIATPAQPRTLLAVLALLALALFVGASARAVVIDGNNQCSVKLGDGTDVVLYGEYESKIQPRGLDDEGEARNEIVPISHTRLTGLAEPPFPASVVATRAGQKTEQEKAIDRFEDAKTARNRNQSKINRLRAAHAPPSFSQYRQSKRYHYLPPGNSLHLSKRPNGVPEFLFVRYTTDEKAEAGGTQGGLFHFLMEWGLTKPQEEELRSLVRTKCKTKDGQAGELVGVMEVEEADEKGSFQIISAVLSDSGMTKSLVKSGHAPTLPGGKVAAAANMNAHGAQLFLSTVEKSRSIADLSVELDFAYTVMLPGAKGRITFHWDKLKENAKTLEAEYRKDYAGQVKTGSSEGCLWFICVGGESTAAQYNYTDTEVSSIFDTLIEQKVVEIQYEGYQADSEYNKAIIEAMLDYFKDSLTEPGDNPGEFAPPPQKGEEEEGEVNRRPTDAKSYIFKQDKLESAFAAKEEVVMLDFGLSVKRRFQVVGNLASWYNSVKDNRNCVIAVNLNDPFYQHRDIRFIMDLEAKEIFEDMVNYVTVNVKKPRSDQAEFNDSVTIDAEYLKTKGIAASISYARGDDKNSETYMYQMQWSLRGGNLFPANPKWIKGNWEGVTLAPPVEKWFIEVEGDLDLMSASDIARTTVELHYPLFGQEKFTAIPLSPRAGQPIVGQPIFVDRGTRGFAYRLIVHDEKEGRMVVPCESGAGNRCIDGWRVEIGERYVYASLPENILAAGDAREQAKQAAKKLGQIGAEKVLNKFEELFAKAD
jgi:hypothetical protein